MFATVNTLLERKQFFLFCLIHLFNTADRLAYNLFDVSHVQAHFDEQLWWHCVFVAAN